MFISKEQIVIGARFSCEYLTNSITIPVEIIEIDFNNHIFKYINNRGKNDYQNLNSNNEIVCDGCKLEPPLSKIPGPPKISNMNQDLNNVDTFTYGENLFKVIIIASSEEFATEEFEKKYKFGGLSFPASAYKNEKLVLIVKVKDPDYISFFQEKDIYTICTNHTYKTNVINKTKTRFELISDSSDIEVTKNITVVEQDSKVFQAEAEDLIGISIPAEIDKLKDQLFGKVKLQGQINSSKKETAGAYRSQLVEIKEEIDDLVIKITSLQDQLKLAKANGG